MHHKNERERRVVLCSSFGCKPESGTLDLVYKNVGNLDWRSGRQMAINQSRFSMSVGVKIRRGKCRRIYQSTTSYDR